MNAEERNRKAKEITAEWIRRGSELKLTTAQLGSLSHELATLEALIPIKQNGFRGVVLTSIVAHFLDDKFDPLDDFYTCKPRSIFEKGIYYALREARIPCGKSDPLNVAKNIQKLDDDWARRRRPESAATAAVTYLKLLQASKKNQQRFSALVLLFFYRLSKYGQYVAELRVDPAEAVGTVPMHLARKIAKFVVECPEGGAVPLYVVGSLLELSRGHSDLYRSVDGVTDSVFGTNTTGKKPADVWEILADGEVGQLYEITVKAIDEKRLDDCVESLQKLGVAPQVVTFICELPRNIDALGVVDGVLIHRGQAFQFLDITAFVTNAYCLLQEAQRIELAKRLHEFIADPNRGVKTKKYWAENMTASQPSV